VAGVLLLALLLVNAAFWRTVLASAERLPYVSIWYFGVALLGLLGLYSLISLAQLLSVTHLFSLSPTGMALANAFYGRALETLCLGGMAIGTLYYVIPRATANPLYSWGLAMLAWLVWLGLSTLAPLARLVDASVPFAITQVGNVATFLLVLPRLPGRREPAAQPQRPLGPRPVAGDRPICAGGAHIPGGQRAAGGDRLTRLGAGTGSGARSGGPASACSPCSARPPSRSWRSAITPSRACCDGIGEGPCSRRRRCGLLSLGAALAGLALIGGGVVHGSLLAQAATPKEIDGFVFWFELVLGAGIGLSALAAAVLALNVFLMYTSARRAEYTIVDASADASSAAVEPAAAPAAQ